MLIFLVLSMVFDFVTTACVGYFVRLSFKERKKFLEMNGKIKKRREIDPAENINTLTTVILGYMNDLERNDVVVLEKTFRIISNNYKDRFIDLKNYLLFNNEELFKWEKMKLFLNDVLRYRAESLNKAYIERDKFYKENDPEKVKGTLSLDKVNKLIKQKERFDSIKNREEESFWFLHDTITNMGFMETYGHISYKVYLALKFLRPYEIFG
jgi:hypothetical protein